MSKSMKIAIVASRFNDLLVEKLIQSSIDTLKENNCSEESIDIFRVSGAFELPLIAKKVGEEAVETVLAAVSEDRAAVLRESADLVFHLMVLWAHRGIALGAVATELARREGVAGFEEKNRRRN